jgi:hypothetical protein
VKVNVFSYAGTSGFPKVHPYVEPVWSVLLLQSQLCSLGKLEHLPGHSLSKAGERPRVLVRNDHQMAGCIWEEVQDYENPLTPMENKVSVVVALLVDFAECAGILFFG